MLKHEKNKDLFFCSLQSNFPKGELAKLNYDFSQMGTFALITNNEIYYKSAAALNLYQFLKAPYSWGVVFKIVPPFLRNWVYDVIARNRKKWFKKEFCVIPKQEDKGRFIN